MHHLHGLPRPSVNNSVLKLAIRAIKRWRPSSRSPSDGRFPITNAMLRQLLSHIRGNHSLPHHDQRMPSAAYTLAFFGFLHCSEFTVPTQRRFDPGRHPTRSDIRISTNHLTYHLKQSKTDQSATGTAIHVCTTGGKLCPVHAMRQYFQYHKALHGPLFQFKSGRPLSAHSRGASQFSP